MSRPDTPSHSRTAARLHRAGLGAATLAVLAVTVVIGLGARSWIGTPFPGFFVLPNRVIPSVGLPGWAGSRDGALYQRTVVALDDQPVADNADLYRRVAAAPPDTALAYTLRDGVATATLTLRSEAFTHTDYWLIFGSYLASGLLYLLLGLLGAWLLPRASLGRALLFLGVAGGTYALSAVGLYGPGMAALRVNALAEACFPAALVYLALVFPRSRGALVRPLGAVAWWLSTVLAVAYELLLDEPGAYSTLHAACESYLGLAGIALIVSLIVEFTRAGETASLRLRSATAGALLGLGVPALVLLLSGLSGGGRLPVNVCGVTAFLFPLCFATGLVRERLAAGRASLAAASA